MFKVGDTVRFKQTLHLYFSGSGSGHDVTPDDVLMVVDVHKTNMDIWCWRLNDRANLCSHTGPYAENWEKVDDQTG